MTHKITVIAPEIKPGRKKPDSEPLSFTNTPASSTPPNPPSAYTRLSLFKIRTIANKPAVAKDPQNATFTPNNGFVIKKIRSGKKESKNLTPLPENTDLSSS
jgi:hypothetical protein